MKRGDERRVLEGGAREGGNGRGRRPCRGRGGRARSERTWLREWAVSQGIDAVSRRKDRGWGLVVMVERAPANRAKEMDQRAIRIWKRARW